MIHNKLFMNYESYSLIDSFVKAMSMMTSYSRMKRTLKFLNLVQRHSMANFGFWAGIIKNDRSFWNYQKRNFKYNFRLAKFKIANWAGSVNWNLTSLTVDVIRFHLEFFFVYGKNFCCTSALAMPFSCCRS